LSAILRFLLLVVALAHPVCWAAESRLVTLIDPAGDDRGNGSLVYPTGGELRPGDLDLRSLDVSRSEAGFTFVATFNNRIQEKWWLPEDGRDNAAQNGITPLPFNINLDIYVDTDRKNGSGFLFTLPGRKVRIDSRYAWERVIVLSPQAKAVRAQLLATLMKNFPDRPRSDAEASIDETMLFASRQRLQDNAISFFVPSKFIGDSDGSNWAITALVTAATPVRDDGNLGVMQLHSAPSATAFSYTSPTLPPPVIDALLPSAERQYRQLSATESLTGLSWGLSSANERDFEDLSRSFGSRLQSLRDLHAQGLISDFDYKTQRDRLLSEL
jgi:hypothetical protein